MKLGPVEPHLRRSTKYINYVIYPMSSSEISIYFTENKQNLLYKKNADIDCTSNFFQFFWVFKSCFNEHGYNFDDILK